MKELNVTWLCPPGACEYVYDNGVIINKDENKFYAILKDYNSKESVEKMIELCNFIPCYFVASVTGKAIFDNYFKEI